MGPELTVPPVTFSAGAATYPANGETPEALLRAADAALYQAKHVGRDRTVSAGALSVDLAVA